MGHWAIGPKTGKEKSVVPSEQRDEGKVEQVSRRGITKTRGQV
jgi:hypothetical protein